MYHATITLPDPQGTLFKAFHAEKQREKQDRSSYSLTQKQKLCVFTITAKDPVALRASTNSIIKLAIVHDKMAILP